MSSSVWVWAFFAFFIVYVLLRYYLFPLPYLKIFIILFVVKLQVLTEFEVI